MNVILDVGLAANPAPHPSQSRGFYWLKVTAQRPTIGRSIKALSVFSAKLFSGLQTLDLKYPLQQSMLKSRCHIHKIFFKLQAVSSGTLLRWNTHRKACSKRIIGTIWFLNNDVWRHKL